MASKPPNLPPGLPQFPVRSFGNPGPYNLAMPPQGPTIGPAHAPGSLGSFRPQIENDARASGISRDLVNEFFQFWEKSQFGTVKTVLNSIKTADNAIKFAKFFYTLRLWGFAVSEATQIFVVVCGLNAPQVLPFIEGVLRNGSRIESALKKTGGVRNALGIVLTAVSIYNHVSRNEYSEAAAKLYKFAMGKAIPWASAIDAIQSFMPAPTSGSSTFFKIIRACDPIGLGGIAVDSFIVMVQSLIDWAMGKQFNEERLGKLVTRMKSGPTSLFAELGENAGDALYDISEMTAHDWAQLGRYTFSELSSFFTRRR